MTESPDPFVLYSLALKRRVEAQEILEHGGGGPHDPGMEARVAALESEMKEVKGSLHRLEVLTTAIGTKLDSMLPTLATKADLAAAAGKIEGIEPRLAGVERLVSSKVLGPFQMFAVFAAMLGLVTALGNLTAGRQAWQFSPPSVERPASAPPASR